MDGITNWQHDSDSYPGNTKYKTLGVPNNPIFVPCPVGHQRGTLVFFMLGHIFSGIHQFNVHIYTLNVYDNSNKIRQITVAGMLKALPYAPKKPMTLRVSRRMTNWVLFIWNDYSMESWPLGCWLIVRSYIHRGVLLLSLQKHTSVDISVTTDDRTMLWLLTVSTSGYLFYCIRIQLQCTLAKGCFISFCDYSFPLHAMG